MMWAVFRTRHKGQTTNKCHMVHSHTSVAEVLAHHSCRGSVHYIKMHIRRAHIDRWYFPLGMFFLASFPILHML